jgi:hypothetical protein
MRGSLFRAKDETLQPPASRERHQKARGKVHGMSSLKRSRIRFAAFLSMMTALAVTVRPSAPIHQGPLSPDFLSASSAPDWNFRKILADIELPTQLAGDLS